MTGDKSVIRRVVCMSSAPHEMSDDDLLDLYGKGRPATIKHNLTGLTTYFRRNFIHIREGDPVQVSNSLVRAEATGWHYNVAIVSDNVVDARLFPKWFLSWTPASSSVPETHDQMLDLRKYREDEIFSIAFSDVICRSFLETFLDSYKRQQ